MQYQEFTDARALLLHYAEVDKRLRAPKKTKPAAAAEPQRAEPIKRDIINLHAPEWRALPSARRFVAGFAESRGFTYAEMVSDSRTQPLTMHRQDCMLALKRARPKLSYRSIAMALGRSDHTTAIHGIQQALRREEREAGE